ERAGQCAAAQAEMLAADIREIMSGDRLFKLNKETEPPSSAPLKYGDMAILIRGRTHLQLLEETLRKAEIPFQTYKGSGFFQRREVQDIFYLLQSLSDPQDDFALLTFLRSGFIALSDPTLFYLSRTRGQTYRQRLQRFNDFLQKKIPLSETVYPEFYSFLQENGYELQLPAGEPQALAQVNDNLEKWQEMAMTGKFSRLLDDLIETLHIRALFAAHPDGEQRTANLDKLIHYLFDFEESRSGVLSDLLETMRKQIAGELKEGEAAILREESDKVHIITFHSAKGLEFPAVFLPFLEKPFKEENLLYFDKAQGFAFTADRSFTRKDCAPFWPEYLKQETGLQNTAEEKRLFYVAATRAKDHLFLYGSVKPEHDSPAAGYLKWLLESLEISAEGDSETGPEFLKRDRFSLSIYRHDLADPDKRDKLPNRDKETAAESHWPVFSPQTLDLMQPVRPDPAGRHFSATQLMLFRENRDRYFQYFYLGPAEPDIQSVPGETPEDAGGAVWGSLMHKLLENFPLRPPGRDEEKARQILFQEGVTDPRELDHLQSKMMQAMQKIRKSSLTEKLKDRPQLSEIHLEMQLAGHFFSGILDFMFQNENGNWEVLDFKTNRISAEEVKSTAQKYEFQVKAYALLASTVYPGQAVYPVTLFFIEPMKTECYSFEPEELSQIRKEIGELIGQAARFELEYFS
ncbi:MAG: 3'-5' exonuclease, partial [Calditrichia bacterium]